MKNLYERSIRIAAIITLVLCTLKCQAQTPIKTLQTAVRMADEAGVPYRVFLVENSRKDCRESLVYYARCVVVRKAVLARVGEQKLLKFKQRIQ